MAEEKRYDVIVIGSGAAGETIGPKCRSTGRTVAMIESRQYGGTCTNRGCNPKKVLAAAADLINRARDMSGKGIWGSLSIDWPELMRFKRTFTEPVSEKKEQTLRNLGIDLYRGEARFTGRNSIEVGGEKLSGKHIALATGMIPRRLNIEGEHLLIDSEAFLDLDTLPDSILFVGGGYIAFEFAHVAARAGSKVIILEMRDTILPAFDQDTVGQLLEATREIGIAVHEGTPVNSIARNADSYKVHAGRDGRQEFSAALVVHGAGRVPNFNGLQVEKAGLETTLRGIEVNEYLQSVSNPAIYAAGDVASTPFALTPTASMEGEIVARNILYGNTMKADYTGIPKVVFSVPSLASVGMLEADVAAQGIAYESKFYDTTSWFASRHIGERHSGAKVLVAKNSKRVLGAHMFGHCAEEVINIFSLAIRGNLTSQNLEKMVWTYPSVASTIKYML